MLCSYEVDTHIAFKLFKKFTFLDPESALLGRSITLSLCLCPFVCVSICKICKKSNVLMNFIFGARLLSNPRKKLFSFEKNRPGVRLSMAVRKFGLMIRYRRKMFDRL